MRKTIITTCLVASLIIIVDSARIGYILLIFLLSGIIPGTNLLVPPNVMLAGFGVITTIILLSIFVSMVNSLQNNKNITTQHVIKSRSNLRRFSNI